MAKRLYRSSNRIFFGVCAGVGEYLDVDPTIVRILTVLLALGSIGTGIIIYLIMAIIMPDNPIK